MSPIFPHLSARFHAELPRRGWRWPTIAAAAAWCIFTGPAQAQCEWSAMGTGMSGGTAQGSVLALTVFEGDLIAGGQFTHAGGQLVDRIARWDGAAWSAVGSGFPATVRGLTVHNGQLIAGGLFTSAGTETVNYIASWDGSMWLPLGSGMSSSVTAVTVYAGDLIAGGLFTSAGGETARHIAHWNGEVWLPLGGGMVPPQPPPPAPPLVAFVDALVVFDRLLIVGGLFNESSGSPGNSIAAWNGTAWQTLGTGVSGGSAPRVRSLGVHQGDLIVGGDFFEAGGIAAQRIARWDGASWHSMGALDARPLALASYNGEIIAGGNFAGFIARWDGTMWEPLNGGASAFVAALAPWDDSVIAGGAFVQAGPVIADRIAAWACSPDCYADCDGNGVLDINDFLCFIDEFALTQHGCPAPPCYADCDGNEVLNINDFLCFIDAFAAGCP